MNTKVSRAITGGVFFLALSFSMTTTAQISFSEVTDSAIGQRSTESWGLSIGDLNGDHWPDVFVGNHRSRASIFLNNGDGTLTDRVLQLDHSRRWLQPLFIDDHGAAFTDYDGDGDDDLWSVTNNCCAPGLLISGSKGLKDKSKKFGIPDLGGLSASVFDLNNDGRQEIINSGVEYYRIKSDKTVKRPKMLDACKESQWAMMTDFNDDDVVDYACVADGTFPNGIYDSSSGKPVDITSVAPSVSSVVDSVAADLNNDLKADLVFMRGVILANQVLSVSPNRVEMAIDSSKFQGRTRINFKSSGPLELSVYTRFENLRVVRGAAASIQNISFKGTITLDPTRGRYQGLTENVNSGDALMVGYDAATQEWSIIQTGNRDWWNLYLVLEGSSSVTNITTEGIRNVDRAIAPAVLMREGGTFVDRTAQTGLSTPQECRAVSVADFDNDMDQDIYMVCTRGVENISNRLYSNNGNGTFSEVFAAGGAAGAIGRGLESGAGTGENVGVFDYNNDGYLDLMVLNGINTQPVRGPGGPRQLFKNNGGFNRWIALELRGTDSNPDAIGARVVANAGGVSQLREQNGGFHRWSQNHDRIHFGLGNNSSTNITVTWPSGLVENFNNVASNNIYEVIEGQGITPVVLGPARSVKVAKKVANACGAPAFDPKFDRGVFVSKDCSTGRWTISLAGGSGQTLSTLSATVTSNKRLKSLKRVSLEGSDFANKSGKRLDLQMTTFSRGVDEVSFIEKPGAKSCFVLDPGNNLPVFFGKRHFPGPVSFDTDTFAPCTVQTSPGVSVVDTVTSESAGVAIVAVELSAPAVAPVNVTVATVAGSATPGSDFFGQSKTLSFAQGEIRKYFKVLLIGDGTAEGTETFDVRILNAGSAPISDATATVSINDDDAGNTTCAPQTNPSADRGLFVWRDCDNRWHIVASAGIGNSAAFAGSLKSTEPITSARSFSIEASDELVLRSNKVKFLFRTAGSGVDGVEVEVPISSSLCLEVTNQPVNASVYVGTSRSVVTEAINPVTFGACP